MSEGLSYFSILMRKLLIEILLTTCILFDADCVTAASNNIHAPLIGTNNVGGIIPSLKPSRISGVAPLSVFFDASDTTDINVTSRPFHEVEYNWSFGDDNAGYWENGVLPTVNSKNTATSPVASHVFEKPGIYTVSVTAFDGKKSAAISTIITVLDPNTAFSDSNTVCFSSTEDPTGCPPGAKNIRTSNFSSAINNYQRSNKRLLFRRGDTFNASTTAIINKTGPGIIGAYGTGARPIILGNGANPILQLSSQFTPGIKDWRIMDLDLDGQSMTSGDGENTGIVAGGGINQVLILHMIIRSLQRGIVADIWGLDYSNKKSRTPHSIWEEWSVVDSTITGIPGCNSTGRGGCSWRVYLAGKRNSIQGNYLDNLDNGGTHVLRCEYMGKGVISNNSISRAGAQQHAIKLHAWDWSTPSVANPGGVGTFTERVVISDNKIVGNTSAWTISIGPQNDGKVSGQPADERVRDIIVERNWITAGPGTYFNIENSASDTTIRNNIIDMSGAKYQYAIFVGQRGTEPVPNNVNIFNNTFYANASPNETVGVQVGKINNVIVKNNLFSARTAENPFMIMGMGSGLIQTHNSTNVQIKNMSPNWISATPLKPDDFRPTEKSYAKDAASFVPVFSDFFKKTRTHHSLGALD